MPETSRRSISIKAVTAILGVVVIVTVVYFVNPVEVRWMPQCAFHLLTGWSCPGCGITRATHALLHGHFAEALAYNYFFCISIPYLALAAYAHFGRSDFAARVNRFVCHPITIAAYIVLFFGWWVLRNILEI